MSQEYVRNSLNILVDRDCWDPLVAEVKTYSGMIFPDNAKERQQTGEVIAVVPGKTLDNGSVAPMEVVVGDKVVYSKYGGTEVKYNNEEYLVLSARDILAVIER